MNPQLACEAPNLLSDLRRVVADFTISVLDSSCNYLLFSLFSLLCNLFLFIIMLKTEWDSTLEIYCK